MEEIDNYKLEEDLKGDHTDNIMNTAELVPFFLFRKIEVERITKKEDLEYVKERLDYNIEQEEDEENKKIFTVLLNVAVKRLEDIDKETQEGDEDQTTNQEEVEKDEANPVPETIEENENPVPETIEITEETNQGEPRVVLVKKIHKLNDDRSDFYVNWRKTG